jgi:hypothetical protein
MKILEEVQDNKEVKVVRKRTATHKTKLAESPEGYDYLTDPDVDTVMKEIYNIVFKNLLAVYEVFKDFFGEENVDLTQDYFVNLELSRITRPDLSYSIPTLKEFKEIYGKKSFNTIYGKDNLSPVPIQDLPKDLFLNIAKVVIKKSLHIECDYDGFERMTDSYYVIVKWDKVTVTNEHDRSIEIEGIYAFQRVQVNGQFDNVFRVNRNIFPLYQLAGHYLHSHASDIPQIGYFSETIEVCLGNGPIRGTLATLNHSFDTNIVLLFCVELDKYIHTESLRGGPYRRLEECTEQKVFEGNNQDRGQKSIRELCNIDSYSIYSIMENILPSALDILYEIIIKKFKYICPDFSVINGTIYPGISLEDLVINTSNYFLEKIDKRHLTSLIENRLIYKGFLKEGVPIFRTNPYDEDNEHGREYWVNLYKPYVDKFMFTFKGKQVKFQVPDIDKKEDEKDKIKTEQNTVLIVNPSLLMILFTEIFASVNLNYNDNKKLYEENKVISKQNLHKNKTEEDEIISTANKSICSKDGVKINQKRFFSI